MIVQLTKLQEELKITFMMNRIVFSLMMCCTVMMTQAQTIHVNNKFWDGASLYTVQEVRMGKIIYMTTKQGGELTLEKVAGEQGEYKIIPSRQAEDCPFGAQFGWRVQHIRQDGLNFLAIRKPNGDAMWTMTLTTDNEEQCELQQKMMLQEEPWNAVNSILLNHAYLDSRVDSKKELRILRNKILAYHGYRFQSEDLQEYFGKISWYKPGNDNNAIKLNIMEQTNLQLIKSEEAARAEDQEAQPAGVMAAPENDWSEAAVASQIRTYFDAVNKTFEEGSGLNPFDLDKQFYSAYWNEIYEAVNEKESNVTSAEQRFFIDDNHWTAGMETPVEVKGIKVELLTGDMAEAVFTLVDKRHGLSQKAILTLDYERGKWRISNWLQKSHDPSGSTLVKMEKYVGR